MITPTRILHRIALAAGLRRIDSDPESRALFVAELDAAIAEQLAKSAELEAFANALAVAAETLRDAFRARAQPEAPQPPPGHPRDGRWSGGFHQPTAVLPKEVRRNVTARFGKDSGLEGLASALMEKGALASDWLPAYRRAPRDLFLPDAIWPVTAGDDRPQRRILRSEDPDAWLRAVYADVPIIARWDAGAHTGPDPGGVPTSSSPTPSAVFSMLESLDIDDDHDVLEIGTGTGWTAALLCARLGAEHITSMEMGVDAAVYAKLFLEGAGFVPGVVVGDGTTGHPPRAPYDRIIAGRAVGEIPYAWVEQTKPGGVIVAPWESAYGGQAVARLTVNDDGTAASGRFTGTSAFTCLRGRRTERTPVDHRPGLGERLGLTVDREGEHVWFDSPDNPLPP